MFLEVEHDHCESVLAALKLSVSSDVCDKISIVCDSGEQIYISLSFLNLFSKLISSITHRSKEDPPQLIFVPLKLTSIENLMVFLSEGKLISDDLDSLKEVFDAARVFSIESTSWSIEIDEKNRQGPPVSQDISENCDSALVRTISEPLPSYQFADLDWGDCELGDEGDVKNNSAFCLQGDIQADTRFVELGLNQIDENGNLVISLPKKRGRPKKKKRGGGRPKKIIVGHAHEMLLSQGERKYPHGSCEFKTAMEGNLLQKSMLKGKRFSCSLCYYQASQKGNLKKHQSAVHEGKKFKCPSCDYQATQRGFLKEHQKSVHEGLRFPCDFCNYQATRKRNLVLHQKFVHDGISYPCNLCDKLFSLRSNLVSHLKAVHSKIKFPCGSCGYQASQKGNLDAHIKAVHLGVRFSCESCDHKSTTKHDLTRHRRSIHEEIKYPCVKCRYKATQRSSLKKHCETWHKYDA